MAALLAGLGAGATGVAAAGATGVGGMIGQFLGSQLMGSANADTGGMASKALNLAMPASPAVPSAADAQTQQGQAQQIYNPNQPQFGQAPTASVQGVQQPNPSGMSPLIAHLLGR